MSTIRNIRPRPMESNDSRKPQRAFLKGSIGVRSGDLHRDADGYPGRNHRMPLCYGVMRDAMREGDSVESSPKSGQGASLLIRYVIRAQCPSRAHPSREQPVNSHRLMD